MSFPFEEEVRGRVKTRTFAADVDVEELVWHRDAEDRTVTVIEGESWWFQMDERLPIQMRPGDVYFIPKETWHRVIRRGSHRLVVEISV